MRESHPVIPSVPPTIRDDEVLQDDNFRGLSATRKTKENQDTVLAKGGDSFKGDDAHSPHKLTFINHYTSILFTIHIFNDCDYAYLQSY